MPYRRSFSRQGKDKEEQRCEGVTTGGAEAGGAKMYQTESKKQIKEKWDERDEQLTAVILWTNMSKRVAWGRPTLVQPAHTLARG